jgi:hypothetical protein
MVKSSESLPAALEKLAATGPAPGLEEKLMLYGRLVGSWDVVSRYLRDDGSWKEFEGEWHFAWVLGGRGVQDILYAKGSPSERRGTTLRCYDEKEDVWHVAWMQPAADEYFFLSGRAEGDRIVQVGKSPKSNELERWTFSEITDESFHWLGEISDDGGESWRLVQEMRATRRRPDAS